MFRICKIITDTTESANSLKQFLGGYPVEITAKIPDDGYYEVPTLMVGWNFMKSNFPNQKISDSDVVENLSWTYNEKECGEIKGQSFHRNIEAFVNKNLYDWLPSKYILFDSLVHGGFDKFVEDGFDKNILTYIHFNDGAL